MNNKKILVTGYSGCGKTALVNRFTNDRFSYSYSSDEQLRIEKKELSLHNKNVNLILWTVPGTASQLKSFKSFYLGTDALIHVIDINNPSSFSDFDAWMEHYKKHMPSTPVYLACNKIDENLNIDTSSYFSDFDCYRTFFTSARSNFMVNEMFYMIAADLMNETYYQKIKSY